jgi:hypothetical protein
MAPNTIVHSEAVMMVLRRPRRSAASAPIPHPTKDPETITSV